MSAGNRVLPEFSSQEIQSLFNQCGVRHLAVRGQLIDEPGKQIGQLAPGCFRAQSRLRCQLLQEVAAKALLDLLRRDREVFSCADSGIDYISLAVFLKRLHESTQPADGTVLP